MLSGFELFARWVPLMFIVSGALSSSSSESLSLSLSLALKLSTRSLLGDSGGKLASPFELGGSSLSLGTLSLAVDAFLENFLFCHSQIDCCYFSHFAVAVDFAIK